MPQVTVYIRADDLELWKAVKKKSKFIHDALHGTVLKLDGRVIKEIKTAPITTQRPLEVNPNPTYIDRAMLP